LVIEVPRYAGQFSVGYGVPLVSLGFLVATKHITFFFFGFGQLLTVAYICRCFVCDTLVRCFGKKVMFGRVAGSVVLGRLFYVYINWSFKTLFTFRGRGSYDKGLSFYSFRRR